MASAIPLAQSQIPGVAPAGGSTTQNAPPAPQPIGVPRPQTMPVAQPVGAPAPQTASQSAPTTAGYNPHILTRTASGASNPWMAPTPAPATQAPASPIPLATSSGGSMPYANVSTNVPGSNTDYTDKTITPGAGVDRIALAKSNFENFKNSTEGEYQAELRDASQQAAGAGQIGSGMARGRFGDIGTARATQLQAAQTQNLNDATSGSVDDAYKNIGIAQQQQGFQQGQQQTAFQQQQQAQLLQEALKNGDFQRYFQLLQAGNSGSPADVQLALSGNYGNQASAAGASAGALASAATRNPNQMPLAAA